MSYQIKSNLSEKQVEADIAEYFGWISKKTPFRLLDVDEQLTGSDKKFYDAGFSIFMQFKISNGLEPISKIPSSKRKNRSKLEDIREFRSKKGLGDDPTLFFGLREKASTALDYQHNILLNYANKYYSQAFYVAPLHLDKDEYYKCLFDSVIRFRSWPFYSRDVRIYDNDWISYVGHIPFLKEHISIIPHVPVTTHEHYYSYSFTGCDIGWHSPELLSESPSRLSDILSKTILNCINNKQFFELNELDRNIEVPLDDFNDNEDPISRMQQKSKILYKRDGIRMFLLLSNRDYLSELKNLV